MAILFENDLVVALNKPPGVSLATSSRADKSSSAAVERLLLSCKEAARPDLLLVHRLDLPTTGVVLLAKTDAAHRALSRAFQSGGARKTYRALVWGHPVPATGAWTEALGRDPRDGRRTKPRPDGKSAVTNYRTLRRLPSVADLELSPETGRTHQIRAHAAAHGHPLVGDDLNGGATRWRGVRDRVLREALARLDRPLLHAARVEIPELALDVSAPMPEDYETVLEILGARSKRAETVKTRRTRS
jgi:23S rRNA pseudouridine1911/1915/1917 synthase